MLLYISCITNRKSQIPDGSLSLTTTLLSDLERRVLLARTLVPFDLALPFFLPAWRSAYSTVFAVVRCPSVCPSHAGTLRKTVCPTKPHIVWLKCSFTLVWLCQPQWCGLPIATLNVAIKPHLMWLQLSHINVAEQATLNVFYKMCCFLLLGFFRHI